MFIGAVNSKTVMQASENEAPDCEFSLNLERIR
jgi:hypothetical protein